MLAYYRVIPGAFTLVGKQPDGDSVRFIADDSSLYDELHRAYRIRLSKDGSVQTRFEGIDTPELHYGSAEQPFGSEPRDQLLAKMGFLSVTFSEAGTVTSAEPATIPGVILSKAADANGRPIVYVLTGEAAESLQNQYEVEVGEELLQQTLNYWLLKEGLAYYTVYTSTPAGHRNLLREVAAEARNQEKGVWALDQSSLFVLESQDDIGPDGQLILPKLFRRATDYLKDVTKGDFRGNLKDWLVWKSEGSRNENDLVILNNRVEVPLSDLVQQRNRSVVFQADLLNITFVEK